MPTPYADLTKELIAAIPGAPDPYNILLAWVAIAIAKLQQWQDAAKKREARVAELEAELAAIKKQEPAAWIGEFAIGPGNKGIYGWDKYPVGTNFYLAAGAQPPTNPAT